jgi:hypothetical protein
MNKKLALFIGCGAALLFCGACRAAAADGIFLVAQGPQGMAISISAPPTAGVAEEFTVAVVVKNEREDRAFNSSSACAQLLPACTTETSMCARGCNS